MNPIRGVGLGAPPRSNLRCLHVTSRPYHARDDAEPGRPTILFILLVLTTVMLALVVRTLASALFLAAVLAGVRGRFIAG